MLLKINLPLSLGVILSLLGCFAHAIPLHLTAWDEKASRVSWWEESEAKASLPELILEIQLPLAFGGTFVDGKENQALSLQLSSAELPKYIDQMIARWNELYQRETTKASGDSLSMPQLLADWFGEHKASFRHSFELKALREIIQCKLGTSCPKSSGYRIEPLKLGSCTLSGQIQENVYVHYLQLKCRASTYALARKYINIQEAYKNTKILIDGKPIGMDFHFSQTQHLEAKLRTNEILAARIPLLNFGNLIDGSYQAKAARVGAHRLTDQRTYYTQQILFPVTGLQGLHLVPPLLARPDGHGEFPVEFRMLFDCGQMQALAGCRQEGR